MQLVSFKDGIEIPEKYIDYIDDLYTDHYAENSMYENVVAFIFSDEYITFIQGQGLRVIWLE